MSARLFTHRLTPTALTVLLLVTALVAQAAPQVPAGSPEFRLAEPSADAGMHDPTAPLPLSLRPGAYEELWRAGSAIVRDFPLPDGNTVDLHLSSFHATSHDAIFVQARPDGDVPFTPPEMRFFRGTVFGEPGSLAYVWLGRGRMGGRIEAAPFGEAEAWAFGLLSPRSSEDASLQHAVVRVEGSRPDAGNYCGAPLVAPAAKREPGPDLRGPIDSTALMEAELAIDTTTEYFDTFGNLADATAYAQALVGAVSAIYERDVNCLMPLSYLRIADGGTDAYTDAPTDSDTLLADVGTEWTSNPEVIDVERTVTQLWTSQSGMGGLAWLDVLCSRGSGYSIAGVTGTATFPLTGYHWDVDVVAHELGHNFGSPHTHCYDPPIDECYVDGSPDCFTGTAVPSVGTIMSYCHLVSTKTLELHPRVQDVIRPKIEEALCIWAAGDPSEILTDSSRGLKLVKNPSEELLENDRGTGGSNQPMVGTRLATWVKRLTPPCYPFTLTQAMVKIFDPSVSVGRPINVLAYTDPTGTGDGDPSTSTLAYSHAEAVESVSTTVWNSYPVTGVTLPSGDFFIGFQDQLADPEETSIMRYDGTRSGDSYLSTRDSSDPAHYMYLDGIAWMVRAKGYCGGYRIEFTWSIPCNDTSVPGQDYGLYQGTLGGVFDDHESITCSTSRDEYFIQTEPPAGDAFYVVVPINKDAEGSYGPKPQAAVPCRLLQEVGPCD